MIVSPIVSREPADECPIDVRSLAAELLAQVASGDAAIARADAEQLARAWLERCGGQAALELLTTRSFEARRLIELCRAILELAPGNARIAETNVSGGLR